MTRNMGGIFDWSAQKYYSKAELLSLIEKRSEKLGECSGRRVLLRADNSADFFISMIALWSVGASVVPIDPRLTDAERDSLRRAVSTECEDPGEALILFTTGTLAAPRGVVLSAKAITNKISTLGRELPLTDMFSTLCFLPLSFGHGLIGNSLVPWLNGAELTIAPPLDVVNAQTLPTILEERKISFFSSVPGVWALLERMIEPPSVPYLRRIFCASAPLGGRTFAAIQKLFPGVPVHNVYGMTEMASWVSLSPELKEAPEGNIGFPIDGEIQLSDGQISVRGHSRMNGYLGEKPLNAGDWFKTGDLAEFHPDTGYVWKGRTGHIVNKGGIKVQLEEIEAIVSSHPNVREALAFKVEDPIVGENFEIAVVLMDPAPAAREDLVNWLNQKVSPQRRPARWHFRDVLPMNSRGKPDRQALRRV